LSQACQRFNWLCHAYGLMTNHYPVRAGLVSRPEQWLWNSYRVTARGSSNSTVLGE
jgi:hypothetical protein